MDAPLDYAARDRRRSRRRLWFVTLIASAAAFGVVGRLLYQRAAPAIAARLELLDAQRRVDALNPPESAVDLPNALYNSTQLARAALGFLAKHGTTQNFTADAFLGQLPNATGDARYVCVRLSTQAVFASPSMPTPVSAVITVVEPATLFDAGRGIRSIRVAGLATYRSGFHLDAPRVDGSRLLLTGVADGQPFAYALTVDAKDNAVLTETSP